MDYDQTKYLGPPRSVPVKQIEMLFGKRSYDNSMAQLLFLCNVF